ncbi:MAG: transporter substrate-binding domain-containing protein [Clostridia bacterium]|nr:transporter substrate-binding domain-containing protein [Clostridia bacterium]
MLCCLFVLFSCLPVYAAGGYKDIRVAVSGKTQPLLFVDEADQPQGVFVDIMNELARIGDLTVEYVIFDRQSQAVEALTAGQVDAVLGVLETDYAKIPSVRTTSEIYSASTCLVIPSGMDSSVWDSSGSGTVSAAYELGTASYSFVSQLKARPIRIMATQEQLYHSLRSEETDIVVGVRDCMQYMMRSDGLQEEYSIALNYVTSVSYSILLNRNDHLRFNALSGCVNRLRSSPEYKGIIDHWVVNTELENAQLRIQRLTNILGAVFGAALIILVSIMLFNSQLRRMVDERTRELQARMKDLEQAYMLRNKLVEHAYAANLVVRLDGTVLLMNDVARRMEGIPIEQRDLPNIENMRVIGPAWNKSPAEMTQPELLVLRDENGERRTYRYQCHRTSVQDERVFIMEDVTSEEQEKQEIFEESKNKALNRIIAGIAHEIKNPLTTIRTYASVAKDMKGDPEFMDAFSSFVPKEADRISKMIETLMNYSRPPRGQKERFDTASVVDDCLGLAYLSSRKHIEITTRLERSLYIYANKEQIRQAVVNLLMNSVESVEQKIDSGSPAEEQTIRVSVYRNGPDVVTEVYDTGNGMTEEQVQQCTDPFFTTKKTGTGMGLPMTKMYIRENGGRLEVESRLGEYTAMRIIFKEDLDNDKTSDMDR